MEALLLNDIDITENTPLGGNIDVDKFRFCIADAQVSKLEEILGETLYEKIKTDYTANTLSGLYAILYDKYIKPFLIHQSAVEYLLVGAYMVSNGGIFKNTPQNGTPVEKNEVDFLVQNQRSKAEMYQARLEKWLVRNNLPEYLVYLSNTIVPASRQSYGGWYFGQSGNDNTPNKSYNDYERDFPNG
jgi:hypothetical protein